MEPEAAPARARHRVLARWRRVPTRHDVALGRHCNRAVRGVRKNKSDRASFDPGGGVAAAAALRSGVLATVLLRMERGSPRRTTWMVVGHSSSGGRTFTKNRRSADRDRQPSVNEGLSFADSSEFEPTEASGRPRSSTVADRRCTPWLRIRLRRHRRAGCHARSRPPPGDHR